MLYLGNFMLLRKSPGHVKIIDSPIINRFQYPECKELFHTTVNLQVQEL